VCRSRPRGGGCGGAAPGCAPPEPRNPNAYIFMHIHIIFTPNCACHVYRCVQKFILGKSYMYHQSFICIIQGRGLRVCRSRPRGGGCCGAARGFSPPTRTLGAVSRPGEGGGRVIDSDMCVRVCVSERDGWRGGGGGQGGGLARARSHERARAREG